MQAIRHAIATLTAGEPLSGPDAGSAMREVLAGEATPSQIGAFLVALRIRGERPEHLVALARVMREFATPVAGLQNPATLVDTCGTGGDGMGTFNISTAAAIIAAAAGARIAKHGNRAVTATPGSGSADVLAALGVNIECPPAASVACLDACGLAFFFAPAYHGAMRHAGPTRREIGVRTILNLLGPLANPAGAARQLVGVGAPHLVDLYAEVLAELGTTHALVARGEDGLDELSLAAPTRLREIRNGILQPATTLAPEDVGLPRCPSQALHGGEDAESRVAIIRAILEGEKSPRRDVALLNAAAALRVAGVEEDWRAAVVLAAKVIDNGAAAGVLATLVKLTNSPAA